MGISLSKGQLETGTDEKKQSLYRESELEKDSEAYTRVWCSGGESGLPLLKVSFNKLYYVIGRVPDR